LILLVPLGIVFILGIIGLLSEPDSSLVRWIYHLQWFLNLHETLGINMYGGQKVPPEVYLSDGAHGDNMALFPLLANQSYPTIIICDGTEDPKENCDNLFISMDLARKKLRCSFITINGNTDIEEEIKSFSENPNLACLRFKVNYHDSGDLEKPLQSSEIIYLKPRKGFADHFKFQENLHGCFCTFCHTKYCSFTTVCCGAFPQHITLNQFFTEDQFNEYNLLGYRTSKFYLTKSGKKKSFTSPPLNIIASV